MPINLQVRAIYTSKIEQTQINYHIRVHYFAQLKPLKIPKRGLENPIKLPNKTDNLISKPGASFEQGSTIIRILHPTKINKTQIDWYCNESRVFYVNRAPINDTWGTYNEEASIRLVFIDVHKKPHFTIRFHYC